MKNWSIKRKIYLGFGIAVLLMLIVSGTAFWTLSYYLADTIRLVNHTYEVISAIERLQSTLQDAQRGQRGYLLTEKESYLEPYHAAIKVVDSQVTALRRMVADNPKQLARLDSVVSQIDDEFKTLTEIIGIQKKEGFKAAQAQVLKDQEKLAMDDIRKKLLEMKNEEQTLLAQRSERTAFGVKLATAVFLFGVLIALGVIGFSVLVINRDFSERGKAEERLAQSELRFRSIFEKSGLGIALTDMQGRIIQSNPSLQELLGYSREELEQRSCEEFVYPADQHTDTGVFREVAAGKRESFTQEKRIVRKNGELFWGRVTVAPIRGESGSP
ncbi:MAG: CHASE3 domain-containing protein, partial [bacterium]